MDSSSASCGGVFVTDNMHSLEAGFCCFVADGLSLWRLCRGREMLSVDSNRGVNSGGGEAVQVHIGAADMTMFLRYVGLVSTRVAADATDGLLPCCIR